MCCVCCVLRVVCVYCVCCVKLEVKDVAARSAARGMWRPRPLRRQRTQQRLCGGLCGRIAVAVEVLVPKLGGDGLHCHASGDLGWWLVGASQRGQDATDWGCVLMW